MHQKLISMLTEVYRKSDAFLHLHWEVIAERYVEALESL